MSSSVKTFGKNLLAGELKHKITIFWLMVLIGICFSPGTKISLHNIVLKSINNFYRQYLSISTLIGIGILGLSYLYLRMTYSYWSKRSVPGPKPSLVVGNTLQRLGITMHILEYYENLYYNENGKDFCGFYDFIKPGLVVGNPELIRSITIKDFDHFANRRVFPMAKINPIANDMLSNATGEKWHRIRTAISPVFTSYKLKQLYNLICRQGDQFTELLKTLGKNGQELEMRELCGQFTMDIITSCAFGIDCEAMNSDRAMFAETTSKIFVLNPIRTLKIIILLIVPFVANLIQFLGIEFTSDEFHFLRKAITKTLRIREEKGIRRGDFLDLMKDTNKLSETTMIAQAVMFLIAGHGNTASALSFTLHLLAVNPAAQEQLRKEILEAKSPNGDVSYDVLRKLPYLDAVIKESLRLYPADPTMERICTEDYQLPGTKLVIRKGQSVIIPIWSLHHDAEYWPDPEKFKPERFLHVPDKDLPPYLPFGCGPRQCIGMKFVQLVVKVALQKILFNFKITPSPNTLHPPPLSPRCFLSTIPIHGLSLSVIPLSEQEK